jgi:hypothetical protein
METQEVLDKIAIAIADIEWTHDIGIAAALDVGKKRVKDWERLKEYIKGAKWSAQHLKDIGYRAGYMSALSFIEGQISEMENEDDSN